MQGGGFLDPMSTYLRFTVTVDDLAPNEIRFVDRSAHSFINRLYITSNGIEAERIEDYDVFAAMMNDSYYSTEQQLFHSFEGFPSQTFAFTDSINLGTGTAAGVNVSPSDTASQILLKSDRYKRELSMILSGGAASSNIFTKVGEPAFFNTAVGAETDKDKVFIDSGEGVTPVASPDIFQAGAFTFGVQGDHPSVYPGTLTRSSGIPASDMLTYDYINNGQTESRISYSETSGTPSPSGTGVRYTTKPTISSIMLGQNQIQFTIPIYSSLIGCIMPEHRFIPLHVLPLDIEFTLSRYALYSSLGGTLGSRNYKISRMEIFANMLFFYNDIPRQVESTVTQHGIFLHLSSYYRAPKTIISGQALPGVAQIQMNFNAVNSVHFVFTYQKYQSLACVRKLHFVSHNLSKLQLQNGTFQIPNEPIESIGVVGNAGTNKNNGHVPFITEWLKAMNKLHDPSLDTGIYANNYCSDILGCQDQPLQFTIPQMLIEATLVNRDDLAIFQDYGRGAPGYPMATMQTVLQLVQKQSNVGRCQFAISLEGEQLSEVRTAITGRKAVLPFNLAMTGQKAEAETSEMFIFLRHDAILEIKPDLSIKLTR